MRKTHVLLLLWVMALVTPLTAQWSIGAGGGFALNFYNYDPQYMVGLDFKAHSGFTADIPVRYQITDRLSLSSGIAMQQKGYVLYGSYLPQGSETPDQFYTNLRRHDTYLVLPLMVECNFGEGRWKGYVGAGGYAGWWWRSRYAYKKIGSLSSGSYHQTQRDYKEFNKDVDRRWEFGVVGGGGVRYELSEVVSIYSAAHVFFALTPQQKDYQIMHFPSRNTTISVQFGFMFNIN